MRHCPWQGGILLLLGEVAKASHPASCLGAVKAFAVHFPLVQRVVKRDTGARRHLVERRRGQHGRVRTGVLLDAHRRLERMLHEEPGWLAARVCDKVGA